MPDYDTKNIPVLDDVIKNEATEAAIADTDEENAAESALAENNLDLFAAEADHLVSEGTEPQLGTIDDIDEENRINSEETPFSALNTEVTNSEIADTEITDITNPTDDASINITEDNLGEKPDNIESALIDYDTNEEYDEAVIDAPSIESPQKVSVDPIALEPIVKDIVKHLMPDLEQQLRFLVQQALEEKLPNEIIKSITTDNHNEEEH